VGPGKELDVSSLEARVLELEQRCKPWPAPRPLYYVNLARALQLEIQLRGIKHLGIESRLERLVKNR